MTDRTQDVPELLPCPFCCGDADFGRDESSYFVNCTDCIASTNVLLPDVGAETKDEAAAAWNRRASEKAARADERRKVVEAVVSYLVQQEHWLDNEREDTESIRLAREWLMEWAENKPAEEKG